MRMGKWRDTFDVYSRVAESDDLEWVATVHGEISQLSAERARRESILQEPDITHVIRCGQDDNLIVGARLTREGTDEEYQIVNVRNPDKPPPGHAKVLVASTEPQLS